MRHLLTEWFRENAMQDEATRVMRRFFRTGGETGKGLNFVCLALVALFYLWFLAIIAHSRENFSLAILIFEMFVITLVMPLSVYGAIAGERERATWDALVLTRLTPTQIMVGKIAWRLGLALLIMAIFALPLMVSQMVGHGSHDPTFGTVMLGELLVLAWSVFLCAFGLWISANAKNGVASVAVLVGCLIGYLVFLPILLGLLHVNMPDWMNPFTAVGAIDANTTEIVDVDGVHTYEHIFGFSIYLLPWLYLAISALLLLATRVALARLEEPRRRVRG